MRALFTLLLSFSPLALAQLCQTWTAQSLGSIDPTISSETSGLSASNLVGNRLYLVSDSDWPHFYITDQTAQQLQQVRIGTLGNYSRDIEDLDVGPCGTKSCLFWGNIGGNNQSRDSVEIILVEELDTFPERVEPMHKLILTYPDGNHDAEGLAVHPNGDIYVLTKEGVSVTGIRSAKLYRARAVPWPEPDAPLPLEHIADLDLRSLSGSLVDLFSHTATALDISPDGKRFLVLTYGNAFEVNLDLATLPDGTVTDIDKATPHTSIAVERLAQQESLSYLGDAYAFVYTTEAKGGNSPLIRYSCQGN